MTLSPSIFGNAPEKADVTLQALRRLYDQVDLKTSKLIQALPGRLTCQTGCHDCCMEGLTVFGVEALNMWRYALQNQGAFQPAASGQCAFLDLRGHCTLYPVRPYVCRTQGLPLRWEDWDETDEIVELRDICHLNASSLDLLNLASSQCWTLGPYEMKLAQMESTLHPDAPLRVPLRALAEALALRIPEAPPFTPKPE